MQTWSQENSRVKINWEVAFEEFNESKMCGNIKRKKKKKSFEPKMEKILAWKYSNQFWYSGHFFLLQYQIEARNFRICHIKAQNWPGSWPTVEKGNWQFIFSFLGSMCFRILNVINIKVIQEQPFFLAVGKPYVSLILKVFYFLWKLKNLS